MSQMDSAEKAVLGIRRKTRRKFSAEGKIRIVLEHLAWRGEHRPALPPGGHHSEFLLPLE